MPHSDPATITYEHHTIALHLDICRSQRKTSPKRYEEALCNRSARFGFSCPAIIRQVEVDDSIEGTCKVRLR
jgi:hypothetical protein